MKSYFTCYIEGYGSQWEASCMDFDISVSGQALDEVKSSLEQAVRSYLLAAQNELEPTRSQLLNRRSPLSVRLNWRWRVLKAALGLPGRNRRFEGSYPLLCPA